MELKIKVYIKIKKIKMLSVNGFGELLSRFLETNISFAFQVERWKIPSVNLRFLGIRFYERDTFSPER